MAGIVIIAFLRKDRVNVLRLLVLHLSNFIVWKALLKNERHVVDLSVLCFTAKPNILPGRSRRLRAKMVQSNRRGSDTYVWSTIIDKLATRKRRL